ncbi:phosphatidylinositol kinase [Acetobacter orientalis]|uniref:Phosphatidylinositol kinase n=1 Tax=Acetobacter orientalis TaxID=146474 RepID=A0A2Z5ZGF3_9PROT|nr:phosphatidylinositol kinase [Acetobacter orientalis]
MYAPALSGQPRLYPIPMPLAGTSYNAPAPKNGFTGLCKGLPDRWGIV